MSYADKVFKGILRDILNNGTTTEGQEIRARWEDDTPAYTVKQFGVCNTYDLREEFPAITVRKTALKSAIDEILWIFQRKSNNINDLNSHIWDQWADANGSIGAAYGAQIGKRYMHHIERECDINELVEKLKPYPSAKFNTNREVYMDQIDAVLYDLKYNPFSRRIMTSIWNFEELRDMNLQPCCWSCTFNVTDEGKDKLILNMQLVQRSNDMIVANNWNTAQYAILLMMVAQVSNMIPGKLMHVITDAHIYDRHIDIANELIDRPEHDAPIVSLNPDVKDFYDFKVEDLIVENYVAEPQIKNIPVAI